MPDLRLTPERREQIERRVQRSLLSLADPDEGSPTPEWPDVYAEDAGDLLHDLGVLERQRDEAQREVERLRAALQSVLSIDDDYPLDPSGYDPDEYQRLRGIIDAARAALAERGGEG